MKVTDLSLHDLRYILNNFPEDFAGHKVFAGGECLSVGTKYQATLDMPDGRQALITSVNRHITAIEAVAGVDIPKPKGQYTWKDVATDGCLGEYIGVTVKAIASLDNIVGYKPDHELSTS
ncbi:hypothetical protein VPHK469_0111 [Vibrio phage K469]